MEEGVPARSSLAVIVVDHTDMSVRARLGRIIGRHNDDSRFGHRHGNGDPIAGIGASNPLCMRLALDDSPSHHYRTFRAAPEITARREASTADFHDTSA